MNNLTKTRGTVYATSTILGLAGLLSLVGLADFNPATGIIDLHPFSVYVVVPLAAPIFGTGLAWIAVIKGWGRKEVKNVD